MRSISERRGKKENGREGKKPERQEEGEQETKRDETRQKIFDKK